MNIDAAAAVETHEDEPPVPNAFAVHNAASANWLVRRIVEARHYADHVRAWAAIEIRRAEREEQFFLHQYGHQLEDWARSEIVTRGSSRRSVCLPGGTVGFRRERPHLLVRDEDDLAAWCRANLVDAIALEIKATGADAEKLGRWHRENRTNASVNESIAKSVLEQHFRGTGECPNGAEIACGEKFFIK